MEENKDIGRRALLYTFQDLRIKTEEAFIRGDLLQAMRLNRELDNVFNALHCYENVYALCATE